ncbi:MAG: hypothetical protein HS104_01455 [Polyangiaceae bacterium]|nr:hypothetical protein [Polyangiaceae bacterium]MCL4754611.1 hypothetical protein [Myxococcales bacterium]
MVRYGFSGGALALLVGLAFAACGSDDGGGKSSSGGSGGSAGDAGGAGGDSGDAGDSGPSLAAICVKSPVAAAPAGDATCPANKPGVADALDEALTKAGIDRCKYGFSDATMAIWKPIFADDEYQLPSFRPLHLGLLRAPAFVKETESWLDAALDGEQAVSSAVLAASVRKGHDIDACAKLDDFAPASVDAAPLAAALVKLIELHGGSANLGDLTAQTKNVPLALQQALVPVLGAVSFAAKEFQAALGTTVSEELDFLSLAHSFVIFPTEPFTVDAANVGYLAKVDEKRIAAAAALVARAVEDAKLAAFADKQVPDLAIDTPIGALVLGGAGASEYFEGSLSERAALLLDVGGDDTYEVPVGAGRRDVPVSLAIDLGGKDNYGYPVYPDAADLPTRPPSDAAGRAVQFGVQGQTLSRKGRQGSGVLGIGLLWDLGGKDDKYASLALSQGAGSVGVGVLFDDGGNDEYVAESTSQGSAMWGIGALLDRAGNDARRSFYASQGFGYVHGVGFAADGGGDDEWFADPGDPKIGGDPLYASAQLPGEGNTSMCQGAGFGRRDDAKKLYMGGGHGVLYDRAGTDKYTASVFAQGSGYWLGFGVLADKAGNDTYDGLWYVQGASAHFALGFHFDHGGDDVYNKGFPIRATSIGVGHDFSGALHVDESGNDYYTAPGLSLGCGNSQGAGGLINIGGTDTYAPAGSNTYGCASLGHGGPFTARDDMPTYGIFVDADGADTYALPSGAPAAGDGQTWSFAVMASTAGAPQTERSGGVDRSPGAVSIP